MDTTATDAELLRGAADKLRGFIAGLGDNGGPWAVGSGPSGYPQTVSNIGVPYVVCQTYTDPGHPPVEGRFIAAMHPGVALALVAVFESWARLAELDADLLGRVGGVETLAVARALFAEERWRAHRPPADLT